MLASRAVSEPLRPQRPLVTRGLQAIFYALMIVFAVAGGVMFVQLILAGWWWELPIVAVLAYFTFVLFRNRVRRSLRTR